MLLSVVMPAHNEEGCIETTIMEIHERLVAEAVPHEIVAINDASTDSTGDILNRLTKIVPILKRVDNQPPNGYGFAVRKGLESFSGDAVVIVMADASDTPEDIVRFYRTMISEDVECVFGTRFATQSTITDYPPIKLVINRLANIFISILFNLHYYDTTNAFKMYRRHVIDGLKPFLSHHFNLTVELPLKAIVRGYSYRIIHNDWINRKTGVSKLKIKEMGSRYLFIVLYCLIEKWLSRGDYRVKR